MVANLFVFSIHLFIIEFEGNFWKSQRTLYTPDSRDVSCAISGDSDSRLRSVTDIEAPRCTPGKKKTSDSQQALVDVNGTQEW